jgi:hypothetical protein
VTTQMAINDATVMAAALADAIAYRRDRACRSTDCDDCIKAVAPHPARFCEEHELDLDLAELYSTLAERN